MLLPFWYVPKGLWMIWWSISWRNPYRWKSRKGTFRQGIELIGLWLNLTQKTRGRLGMFDPIHMVAWNRIYKNSKYPV